MHLGQLCQERRDSGHVSITAGNVVEQVVKHAFSEPIGSQNKPPCFQVHNIGQTTRLIRVIFVNTCIGPRRDPVTSTAYFFSLVNGPPYHQILCWRIVQHVGNGDIHVHLCAPSAGHGF